MRSPANWSNAEINNLPNLFYYYKSKNIKLNKSAIIKEFKVVIGVDKRRAQIKNHVDSLKIKIKSYEELINTTSVGVDS